MEQRYKCALTVSRILRVLAILLPTILWSISAWAVEKIPKYRTRYQDGCHTSGIYPATKRIQNREMSSGYSVDVCSGGTTIFRAPKVILKPGFRAQRGSTFRAGIPVFDVHFAVLDAKAAAKDSALNEDPDNVGATRAKFQSIIDTLNERFISEDNERLVRFRLKSYTTWNDILGAGLENDPCVSYIQTSGDDFKSKVFNDHFGGKDEESSACACSPSGTIIRDMNALNFYIYDDVENDVGHGRRNSGYPWVIVDIDRINGTEYGVHGGH